MQILTNRRCRRPDLLSHSVPRNSTYKIIVLPGIVIRIDSHRCIIQNITHELGNNIPYGRYLFFADAVNDADLCVRGICQIRKGHEPGIFECCRANTGPRFFQLIDRDVREGTAGICL